MSVGQLERAMDSFHSYFWARFTQPAALAYVADERVRARVVAALAAATATFVARVAPTLRGPFHSATFWRAGLGLTYGCELRAEAPGGAADLYAADPDHFDRRLAACAARAGAPVRAGPDGGYLPARRTAAGRARAGWALRRLYGKITSVLRLVKAAGTFDEPLDYLLWKIRRHSGVYIAPTERQRRHPLVFAWPLLWRLYRRGGFR